MRMLSLHIVALMLCVTAYASDLTIVIRGDKVVDKKQIAAAIAGEMSDSMIVNKVKNLFASAAYPGAVVDMVHGKGTDSLIITTGDRFLISRVDITGDTIAAHEAVDLGGYSGEPATASEFGAMAGDILDDYADNGYPFAQVSVDDLQLSDTNTIDVTLNIISGPHAVFDTCLVVTADAQTATYLSRISGIRAGDTFSESKLRDAVHLFRSLEYITVDDSVAEDFSDDHTICRPVFTVRQLPSNLLEGSLGYQPAYGNQSAYVRGYAHVILENPFGRGRRIIFRYNKRNPISHEVSLGYYQPFIFYRPLSASCNLEQLKFDSLYQKLSFDATVEYGEGRGQSLRISGGWSKYTPLGSVYRGVLHSRRWWWGIGSTIWLTQSPLRQRLDLDIKYGIKQQFAFAGVEPDDPRISDTRLSAMYYLDVPVARFLRQSVRLSAAGIATDEQVIPPSDLYGIGGARNLRGYREEQFLCDRYALVTLQPELLVAKNAQFHIFTDAAWFRQPSTGRLSRVGAGGGFEFALPNGHLVMDVAWGKDDGLGDGKLYVILENRF
jgi:outer membrane protein assembly factor BamA